MKRDIDSKTGNFVGSYTLSNGREIDANCGFIGINSEGELSEGYDGHLCFGDSDRGKLNAAERKEIADFMIALWVEWCDK